MSKQARRQDQTSILNISIDNFTREEILERVKSFLSGPAFHQIATVNPEFLLEAEKNSEFHSVLQNCDLRIADGFGITLAMLFRGEKLKCRFPGADLMEEILSIANNQKLGVFLAVKQNGLSTFEETKRAILKKYPNIPIDGADIDIEEFGNWKLEIGNYAIALCNFGMSTQEIYLEKLKDKNNTLRVSMGVGGSFDYLTGRKKRAPRWVQNIGLEWFWRLILQPKRFVRIWKAVVIFPFRLFFATIKKPDLNT